MVEKDNNGMSEEDMVGEDMKKTCPSQEDAQSQRK